MMKNKFLIVFTLMSVLSTVGCNGDSNSSGRSTVNLNSDEELPNPVSESYYDVGLLSLQTLIPIINSPHATHIPLGDAPIEGMLVVSVRFLEKPSDIQIYVVDNDSGQETIVVLDPRSMNDESAYVGEFASPSDDFKFKLVGVTLSGENFVLEVPKQFQ